MSSQSVPSTSINVKSDRSGRTRYTVQYKQEVLAAFESSSLSAPDFAKQCGTKYSTMAAWIASRKRGGQTPARVNAPAFLFTNKSRKLIKILFAYLTWVFGELARNPRPEKPEDLLPQAWAKAHPKAGSSGRREMKV